VDPEIETVFAKGRMLMRSGCVAGMEVDVTPEAARELFMKAWDARTMIATRPSPRISSHAGSRESRSA
jgi:hypothetical protein